MRWARPQVRPPIPKSSRPRPCAVTGVFVPQRIERKRRPRNAGSDFLRNFREWYIVAIAACLILAGLYVASVPSTPTRSAGPTPAEPSTQAPQSQIASQSPAPASAQSPDARPAAAVRPPAPVTSAAPSRPEAPSGPAASQAPGHPPSPAQPAAVPARTHEAMEAASPPAETVAHAPSKPAPAAAIGGDATAGRQVYRKCQACHSLEAGKNTLGPSLAGIVGKKSGEVPNYNYSAEMKAANIVWDAATLDAYLLDPQKVIPQNKMPFPGLKTANERKDVIAYLVAATSPAGAPAVAQRAPPPAAAPAQPSTPTDQRAVGYMPDARYTLRSGIAEGRMVYLGVGGTIDGQVNPVLSVRGGTDCPDHPDQRRRGRARHRIPRPGCEIAAHYRPRRKHDHRLPRHARRRFRLPVQRPWSRTGGHARTIHRHASAARAGPG